MSREKFYKKDGGTLIMEIPLSQVASNLYDDGVELVDNIVGVIAGDEMGFAQSIDMSYAGKPPQIGGWLAMFYGDEEEFVALCKELSVSLEIMPVCEKCNKVIYGSHTIGVKGPLCYDCSRLVERSFPFGKKGEKENDEGKEGEEV